MENKRSIFFIIGVMVFIMLLGILNPTKAYAKTDINKATITVSHAKFYYNGGNEIKPSVVVLYKNKKLMENVDYKVSYQNNKNATERTGKKAKVIITGKGGLYTGTYTEEFDIYRCPIDGAKVTMTGFPSRYK